MAVRTLLKSALKRMAIFLGCAILSFSVGMIVYSFGAHSAGYLIILPGIVGGGLWALPGQANRALLALIVVLGLVGSVIAMLAAGWLFQISVVCFVIMFVLAGVAQYRNIDSGDSDRSEDDSFMSHFYTDGTDRNDPSGI